MTQSNNDAPASSMPDHFDRLMGQLDGLPDVVQTKATTLTVTPPLGVGGTQLFIVRTVRQRDEGDTLFLVYVDGGSERAVRLVLPPRVTDAIARQRDQLSSQNRRKGARAAVQTRAERGIEPGFLKRPHRGGGRKRKGARKK